ncbi:pyridoxamine 5'-phosphate oxidase family protein (plasmid) [Aliirhizobium terrae]|uniref:pyridoxamine 5'-phosphate oxidase family protein n=1 Tax=Terrirhizobium terrae TaxID=2926709 RepID=UPI002576ED57|nr:pyridoxamine 5'-phosphate oxidase family protein [Rhizobium sp. CC-CFT758]WJH38849.1 pyridoxamine 5'-phosphate oxidase family protein [Rhizobium sp. CC-CFT758]
MTTMTMNELSKKLGKIDFCMFNTNGPESIVSRPMSNNGDVEYDGNSWFFSYEDTRKVRDINRDTGVTLDFTALPSLLGKPGIFVAVDGEANLIHDKSPFEAHWVSDLERWFPEGIDTTGIVLIKVSARSIEYWGGEETGRIELAAVDALAGGAV